MASRKYSGKQRQCRGGKQEEERERRREKRRGMRGRKSKEGKGRERKRRHGERVGEWCIIYSLPWFKTRSQASKGSPKKQLVENKSRTKTKPESHPPCPGRQFCPLSARVFQYTWWGRRRGAPSGHGPSQVPSDQPRRQARRGRRGSRSPGPRGWPTWG